MTRTEAIFNGFRNIFRIAGRSPRAEYAPFASLIIALWVANFLGRIALERWSWVSKFQDHDLDRLNTLFFLLIASLALYAVLAALMFTAITRRLHDLGYSARWAVAIYAAPVLSVILPIALMKRYSVISPPTEISDDGRGIGSAFLAFYLMLLTLAIDLIVAIVLCFKPSQPGPNRYGPNPSEASK